MNGWHVAFDPHLPLVALACVAAVAVLLLCYAAWRRARGTPLRLLLFAVLILALANPILRREERDPLPDTVLVAVDRSPSQSIDGRAAATDAALAELTEAIAGIAGMELEVDEIDGHDGTQALAALGEALAELPTDRLAGIVLLTDGQVHDTARGLSLPDDVPFHALLTGRPGEIDRRLVIERAPSFAMVGEPQRITVRALEDGGEPLPVGITVRRNGREMATLTVEPGRSIDIDFTLESAGPSVFEIEAETRPDEITDLNNRAVVTINGVRDRLRVLLVSGEPYPGLRVWRNLLKADPSVDLVHFTILRPPEKQDGTPIRELALIAFPSRELFEVKLDEFDLVIFDRYSRRGLLPLAYLDNIARYVEDGGGLLEAAGPEFAEPLSLFRTPLARVLPARPSGEIYERAFRPTLTDIGRRHPVTRDLQPDPAADPTWGQWYRQVDVEPAQGAPVLLTGVSDRPLLVLDRVGEGRVAQLLSDQAWLWARGHDGGGPQADLLRRLVHWLMKEPELDEEALIAQPDDDGIAITRRTLGTSPIEVAVTSPSGDQRAIELRPDDRGVARTVIAADEAGLYRIEDGQQVTFAEPRPISPIELADMRATPDLLAASVEASGGAITWLGEGGVPDLRRVEPGRRARGRGWIGLVDHEAYTVTGARQATLLPPWLALLVVAGLAAATWWREGKV